MKLEEVRRQATPGPFSINKWPDGSVVIESRWFSVGQVFARKPGEGVSTWKAKNPEATARLLVHCVNHFDEAVEGLKEIDKACPFEGSTKRESIAFGRIKCVARELIAELEEVSETQTHTDANGGKPEGTGSQGRTEGRCQSRPAKVTGGSAMGKAVKMRLEAGKTREATFKFACERCRQHYEAYEDMRGDPLTCQSCGGSMRIPLASEGRDLPIIRTLGPARPAVETAPQTPPRSWIATLAEATQLSRELNSHGMRVRAPALRRVELSDGSATFTYADGSTTRVTRSGPDSFNISHDH